MTPIKVRLRSTAELLASRPSLIFLLWAFWLTFPFFILGEWSYLLYTDEGQNFVPYRMVLGERLFDFIEPSWTPGISGGLDSRATGHSVTLDAALYAILPDWAAYGLFRFILAAAGGYFLYRLLVDRFHVEPWFAIPAGLLFVAAPPFGVSNPPMFQTLIANIAVLWALPYLIRPGWRGVFLAVGAGIVFAANSIYAYSFSFLPMLFLVGLISRQRLDFVLFAVLFTAGYLVANGQDVAAGLLNNPLSQRIHAPSSNIPTYVDSLVDSLWIPAIFILAWITGPPKVHRDLWLGLITFVLLAMPIAFIGLGDLTGNDALISAHLRTVESTYPLRIIAPAVLAVRLFGQFPGYLTNRVKLAVAVTAIVAALWLSAAVKAGELWDWLHGATFAGAFKHPDPQELRERTKDAPPFRVATVTAFRKGMRVEPTMVWTYGFEMSGGYSAMYPARYAEFWQAVTANLRAIDLEMNGYKKIINPRVELGLTRGLIWEMCAPNNIKTCEIGFNKYYDLDLLSLGNARFIVSPLPLRHPSLKLLPSTLRKTLLETEDNKVRYKWLATLKGEFQMATALFIYENFDYLPRYFMASGVRVFQNREHLLQTMRENSPDQLRRSAFVLDKDIAGIDLPRRAPAGVNAVPSNTVSLIHYGPDEIVLQVEARTGGVLVATNTYSPFWKACVNGRPAQIFPVYHTFQAVRLSAGEHRVVLRYAPPYALGSGDFCRE